MSCSVNERDIGALQNYMLMILLQKIWCSLQLAKEGALLMPGPVHQWREKVRGSINGTWPMGKLPGQKEIHKSSLKTNLKKLKSILI